MQHVPDILPAYFHTFFFSSQSSNIFSRAQVYIISGCGYPIFPCATKRLCCRPVIDERLLPIERLSRTMKGSAYVWNSGSFLLRFLKIVSNDDSHQGHQARQDPKGPQDLSEPLDYK